MQCVNKNYFSKKARINTEGKLQTKTFSLIFKSTPNQGSEDLQIPGGVSSSGGDVPFQIHYEGQHHVNNDR